MRQSRDMTWPRLARPRLCRMARSLARGKPRALGRKAALKRAKAARSFPTTHGRVHVPTTINIEMLENKKHKTDISCGDLVFSSDIQLKETYINQSFMTS